jgi:hypothetical protein
MMLKRSRSSSPAMMSVNDVQRIMKRPTMYLEARDLLAKTRRNGKETQKNEKETMENQREIHE